MILITKLIFFISKSLRMFTQLLSNLNWLHIAAAAVAFFMLGAIWYSPILFAKPWARMVNMNMTDPNAKKGMGVMMFGSFILMVVCCIALAILYAIIHVDSALSAVKFGLFFGVG